MEYKDIQIMELDKKISFIQEKMDEINEERLSNKGALSLDSFNELSSLKKQKTHYILEKYDIINGTHKVQIKELENKVIYMSYYLGEAKTKLAKANVFNRRKLEERVESLEITINQLQNFIIDLEEQDGIIEDRNASLTLKK